MAIEGRIRLAAFEVRAGAHRVRVDAESDLCIQAGDLLFLHGPTGAGKSLLARALVAAGAGWATPLRCGLVAQEPSTFSDPYTPVAAQLQQAGAAKADLPDLLRRLGTRRGDGRAADLSVGQQQRLLVLLQQVRRLDLLVADEPTSALDPLNRRGLVDLLVQGLVMGNPGALLVVTHDPLLPALARRAWEIHAGDAPFPGRCLALALQPDGAFALRRPSPPAESTPRLWWPCRRYLQHIEKQTGTPPSDLAGALRRRGLGSLREYQRDLPAHVATGDPLLIDGAYFHGRPHRAPGIDLGTRPLALRRGACAALLGESGVGKTTLLRLAAGLTRRGWLSRRRQNAPLVRLVFQNPDSTTLNPSQTLGQLIAGLPQAGAARLVRPLMERLHLDPALLDRDPPTLSGGEKYRCGLLLALLGEPDFLLLDEPFAAVDGQTQETIADLCLDLKRGALPFFRRGEPVGVLLITHQAEIAFQLCDRWYLLDRRRGIPYGECRWQGTPLEALDAHENGRIADATLKRLLAEVFADGTESQAR